VKKFEQMVHSQISRIREGVRGVDFIRFALSIVVRQRGQAYSCSFLEPAGIFSKEAAGRVPLMIKL